ncbi:MAG: arginine decarboxylase, pyruvoyl-dependent [Dethiobacter sp.]|jgi:arginine decarboxylase|nr:arginine decarboxylase, pyruvoyl-dependent [Dethiobacter sp.]MBS3902234.1 arginine decarboxylase, pyruvoyl-dependent [Dethiobacter sp.]MBS3989221.1 arginine decarboxylase, pyruvoyl-dependent [Dethiobacter sp.]
MLPTPKKFKIVAAAAEGSHKLTAFDNALLAAGIGNVNLVRISSILPPSAKQDQALELPPGSLVPTAYGSIVCDQPGTKIAAAVGVGFSADTFGVIMEFSGMCSKQEAEDKIAGMLKDAFENRGIPLVKTEIRAVEHTVSSIGCAFAAVALWY